MARSVTTIDGMRELEEQLKALPQGVAKRASMNAMRRASAKMKSAIEERAPVGRTGNLRNSVKIKARSQSRAGFSEFSGVLQSGGSYRDAQQALRAARRSDDGTKGARITVEVGVYAPHAHLVEFGTVDRFHKGSGKSVGAMPMNPFMRPAFDAAAASCALAIQTELKAEIERIAKRGPKIRASKAGLVDG